MTTRTTTEIKCQCGHTGRIHMRENDAPFSRQYEEYSVDGLNAKHDQYYIDGGYTTLEKAIEYMEPKCPACGRELGVANIVGP